jgi:hypothetical protein
MFSSVLPLVGPDHHSAKKVLILTMKLWKMKKSSDFDHEIMNLVEKNVGTPAILHRILVFLQVPEKITPWPVESSLNFLG